MKRFNQSGSHLLLAAVGVVAVGFIAFAGYWVSSHGSNDDEATSISKSVVIEPGAIQTKADLEQASQSLDSSISDVDSSVNGASLDIDLNELL